MDEVQLTRELVRINSENPPGNEKGIAKYVFDFLDDLKCPVELVKFGDKRFDVISSNGKGNGLMLNSHIDTVPIGRLENWKYDPFSGKIINGKIYGRGSCDSKCNVAVILSAVKKFAKQSFKRKLLITLVGDEEVGFRGSNYLIENRKNLFKDVGYGVISDSDLKIRIAQKGVLHLRFIFKGKAAHGSKPELGSNAIAKATEFIQEINRSTKKLTSEEDPLLGRGTINIGTISGGTKVNIVPDYCVVGVDRRLTYGETPSYAVAQFKKILKKLKLEAKIEFDNVPKEAVKVAENSEIVKILQNIGNLVGKSSGYTEMELYYRKLGIECVALGASNDTAHSDNEYVKIDDLRKSKYIFENLIKKWCL
ncbi:MAG: M20 family metallopeptidase [Candidatus Aenigmarchaeota archaeon]|nr:M20 family metallopeptidase [Candidatus Aenigmarchaeota archaeon]